MHRLSALVIMSLVSAQGGAAPKKPPETPPPSVPLRASDQWRVAETRIGCTLRAEIPGGRKIRAVVLTPQFGTASIGSLQLDLVPGTLPQLFNMGLKINSAQPRTALGLPAQDSAGLQTLIQLQPPELRELEMGSAVLVGVPGETVAFSTSLAVSMLIQLGRCDQRVLEAVLGGPRPRATSDAKGRITGLFSSEDYPKESLIRAEQGIVSAVFRIGANGRIAKCVIAESSGSATLDRKTCDILRNRARYSPARDMNDRAVEGLGRARIHWGLPVDRGTFVKP